MSFPQLGCCRGPDKYILWQDPQTVVPNGFCCEEITGRPKSITIKKIHWIIPGAYTVLYLHFYSAAFYLLNWKSYTPGSPLAIERRMSFYCRVISWHICRQFNIVSQFMWFSFLFTEARKRYIGWIGRDHSMPQHNHLRAGGLCYGGG